MRILHLDTEKTWRGGENQMRFLIQGLGEKGVEQWAAAPSTSIAYLEKRWNCPTWALASGHPLDVRNWYQIHLLIQKHHIQLIDAHSAKAHNLALSVAQFHPDLKVIVHRRVDNPIKKQFFTRKKYLNPRVNHFVAISDAIAQMLRDYGVPSEKVSVVKSAVSAEIYQSINRTEVRRALCQRLHLSTQTTLIGNASALSPQKGYETLLRAVAEMPSHFSKFKVLIAGDGELKSDLEKMSSELGLNDQVYFLGFLKNVPEFLSCLDILAIPSNNEGLGTVILDAILAGCCPVGSRVGGIPEIIIPDRTGLLIEPADHQKLAQHLVNLIQNPTLRETLVSGAKQHVKNNFSLQAMVEGNHQVYKKVLQS